MQNSKVRAVALTDTSVSNIETQINAIITTEEASGFVLERTEVIGDKMLLHFKNQSVLPGGGGIKKAVLSFDFSDIAAAALTNTLAIPDTPASMTPIAAVFEVTTAFAGGSVSSLTGQAGDSSDPDGLQAAQNLLTTGVKGVAGGAYIGDVLNSFSGEALFTAIGDNLDQLTQGVGTLTVFYLDHS